MSRKPIAVHWHPMDPSSDATMACEWAADVCFKRATYQREEVLDDQVSMKTYYCDEHTRTMKGEA